MLNYKIEMGTHTHRNSEKSQKCHLLMNKKWKNSAQHYEAYNT